MDKKKDTKEQNTIDTAIINCSDKIKEHRVQANFFLGFLIVFVLGYIAVSYTLFSHDTATHFDITTFELANQKAIEAYKLYNETNNLVEENISNTNILIELINHTKNKKDLDSLFKYVGEHNKIMNDFRNDLNEVSYGIDTSIAITKKLARKLREEKIPENKLEMNMFYYLLYALFIIIFGVLTSFYRYHLKEISKLEQYYFGFLRIRIAGNNSLTGYDDLVKDSLTRDAFTFESPSKKITSPVPGHPGSDILTNFLNKLLDKFELTPKKHK